MRKHMTTFIALSLFLSGGATADQSSTTEQDIIDLISLLVGNFNNNTQFNAQVSAENLKYSNLYHYRLRIDSPALPGHWVFAQINEEDRPEAYRQTVMEFYTDASGRIKSRAWGFKDKNMKAEGMPSADFLNSLSRDQLAQGLPDNCAMNWRRRGGQFEGIIDHRECVIQSRYKDEKRQLFAEEIVFKHGLWAREGAYRMDGALAFGLDDGKFYRYQRTQ